MTVAVDWEWNCIRQSSLLSILRSDELCFAPNRMTVADDWELNSIFISCFFFFHFHFTTSLIPCGKFGSPYPGKATTAAAKAALPVANSACGIFVRPNQGVAVNASHLWQAHSCPCMRLHTGNRQYSLFSVLWSGELRFTLMRPKRL